MATSWICKKKFLSTITSTSNSATLQAHNAPLFKLTMHHLLHNVCIKSSLEAMLTGLKNTDLQWGCSVLPTLRGQTQKRTWLIQPKPCILPAGHDPHFSHYTDYFPAAQCKTEAQPGWLAQHFLLVLFFPGQRLCHCVLLTLCLNTTV